MSPRIDIFALEITESFADIYSKLSKRIFQNSSLSDSIDHIEGVLFVKDLRHLDEKRFWNTLIREPFFIPENKKLDNLLKDFQRRVILPLWWMNTGNSGLVSLEDVIEEIVGDISDEFDDDNVNFTKIDEKLSFEGK
jgi:CBS domain containing-hemolysin-like protein